MWRCDGRKRLEANNYSDLRSKANEADRHRHTPWLNYIQFQAVKYDTLRMYMPAMQRVLVK